MYWLQHELQEGEHGESHGPMHAFMVYSCGCLSVYLVMMLINLAEWHDYRSWHGELHKLYRLHPYGWCVYVQSRVGAGGASVCI